jgi:hypothetical protein
VAERRAPVELDPETFRALGYQLIDELTGLLAELRSPSSRPVVPEQTAADVEAALGDAPLPTGGEVFVSNAVIDGTYFLRACIVNFRTTEDDIRALPEVVKRVGSELVATATH